MSKSSLRVNLFTTCAVGAFCILSVASPVLAQSASAAKPVSERTVEEVIVTGTSIRGIAPTGSAVIGVDRAQIEAAAPRTTADLMASVPQIAQFNSVPTGGNLLGGTVAQISLRPNLGTGSTLVLVDGHRLVLSGITAGRPDVSNVPPAAIARVEVIADGASAIYGSDAVGGVINFITRKNYRGWETSGRYSSADHYDGFDVSQLFGKSWTGGSLMIAGEYQGHSSLSTHDRPYWSDVGTISPGLNSSCPVASVGASVPRCDQAQIGGNLQPEETRGSIFGSLHQSLTDSIEAWFDTTYSTDRRSSVDVQPALPASTFSARNPFNTSGVNQNIFYRPVTEFGTGLARHVSMDVIQFDGGFDFKLSHDWAGTVFGAYGQSKNRVVADGTNNVAYQAAMAATTAATAFDPFGHKTPSTVLAQILDATDISDIKQTLGQVITKFDGPLFAIPGGLVRLAVGGELRKETQEGSRRVGSPNSILSVGAGYLSKGEADGSRTVSSAFGELYVPLVGDENQIPLVQSLSLSLAARYDDYSDFGGTTNPKVGLDWRITDDVRLFGSWSTSFQAPGLADLSAGAVDTRIQAIFAASNFQPSGPGNALYAGTPGMVIAGGGLNLQPQTSDNISVGFEVTPTWWKGFRGSLSYYSIDFQNYVTVPGPPGLWTIPALTAKYGIKAPIVNGAIVPFTATSPEVVRFTSILPVDGAVLPPQVYWIAILQRANVSHKKQEGFDFDLSQRLDFGTSSITARVAGTVITKDLLDGGPGTPFTDVLPTDNAQRYSASLDYRSGALTAGASFNHLSHRYSTTAQTAHIAAFDLLNLRAAYDFAEGGLLGGTQLSVNVENALDKDPPAQIDAVGGHAATLNMLGRVVSVGFKKRW